MERPCGTRQLAFRSALGRLDRVSDTRRPTRPAIVRLLGGHEPTATWLASDEARSVLADPERRARLYEEMHADQSSALAPLLRASLTHEIEYRRSGQSQELEDDTFEQIYWCALLLSGLGFVKDILPLWRAKQTNFDTGAAFDVQFLVGAGLEESLAHLDSLDDPESSRAARYLRESAVAGDFDDLGSWRAWRRSYFAPKDRE